MKRLAAGVLLVLLGFLTTPTPVPIYDGLGQPDQPYRYAGRAHAPRSTSTTVPTQHGVSTIIELTTPETGPQFDLILDAGAFSTSTPTFTLTTTPLPGDGQHLATGIVEGNIYRVSGTAGARFRPSPADLLNLRATVMTRPIPIIEERPNTTGSWRPLATQQTGQDVLGATFAGPGDYAVVRPLAATKVSSGGGLTATRLWVLVAGVLVMAMLTITILRRSSDERVDAG